MRNGCIDHGKAGGTGKGYTTITLKGIGVTTLHRWVYCDHNGVDILAIKGKVVRHKCDNPRCINPEHLELGTNKDNSQDMVSRGRSGAGGRNSRAKLTAEQVQQIKVLVSSGKLHREVAELFGVARNTVSRIVGGTRWLSN